MRHLERHAQLGPKQFAQLREIYRAACRVKSQLPETHPASMTATKLIAAFACQSSIDELWLSEVEPAGTA